MYRGVLCSTVQQSIRRGIEAPGLVFHQELALEEFADPIMLRNCGQPLIEQVLQVEMVRVHNELTQPKVRPPMVHSLDEADQLLLIHGELGVV
jgi:hypothetical protein